MRRSTDPLFAVTDADRSRLRPAERRALAVVCVCPGVTVDELRQRLGVGRARVWQMLDRLESMGVVCRDGGPPRRLGRHRRPPSPTELRRAVGPVLPLALRTILALEHLVTGPCSATELSRALAISRHSARDLLARLELDGYLVRVDSPRGAARFGLTPRTRALSRRLLLAPSEHMPS
ncbi:MAG: MarR family transcriptional regulator [Solirubrobacteraceae bacterium]